MYRSLFAALILVILTAVLSGCGCVEQSMAEDKIVKCAPAITGPADHYQAHVSGISGHSVKQVTLIGENVRTKPGLVVQHLDITLQGISFSRKPFRLISVQHAMVTVRLTDTAINAFLAKQPPTDLDGLHNMVVTFQRGRVTVRARRMLGGFEVPLATTGQLQEQHGTKLFFIPRVVSVNGTPVSPQARETLMKFLNPLADLSSVRFQPHITKIELQPGVAIVSGTADLAHIGDQVLSFKF